MKAEQIKDLQQQKIILKEINSVLKRQIQKLGIPQKKYASTKTGFNLTKNVKMYSKERRSKLEIYYDILEAIIRESPFGNVKPTRIQFSSRISYDKLQRYFDELQSKQMLITNPIFVTEKGRQFLKKYSEILLVEK